MSLTAHLNNEATVFYRKGRFEEALASFGQILSSLKAKNVAPQFTILSNRAACFIKLGRCEEALSDLDAAERSVRRAPCSDLPSLLKILARKGEALNGLKQPHLAMDIFQEILSLDPQHEAAKRGMETSVVLSTMSDGDDPTSILNSFLEPLMTPKQAENDQATRDIYNYLRIKSDVILPGRYVSNLSCCQTVKSLDSLRLALELAIKQNRDERGIDPRVLIIGSAFILPLMALQAEAYHVTVCEPCLYLAAGAKSVLEANGADPESYTIINSRPSDLTTSDLPIPCNILLCAYPLISDGFLLEPSFFPSLASVIRSSFVVKDSIIIPSSISIKAQAMSKDDSRALSQPKHIMKIDLSKDLKAASASCELEMTEEGEWPQVQISEEITLYGDLILNCNGLMHDLQCGRTILRGDESHTLRASINRSDFALWIDGRCVSDEPKSLKPAQACSKGQEKLILRAVRSIKDEVRVLIIGQDRDSFSLTAARSGASVVVVEINQSRSFEARRMVALNKLGSKVTVLNMNPKELRPSHLFDGKGANVVIACDLLAGMPSHGAVGSFRGIIRKNASLLINGEEAIIVPREVCLSVQGIQVSPPCYDGMNLTSLSEYRYSESASPVNLVNLPYKTLTVMRETQIDLLGQDGPVDSLVLQIAEQGLMNAVLIFGCDGQPMIKYLDSAAMLTVGATVEVKMGPSYEVIAETCTLPMVSVPKPPWLDKWGGGASVENPHVQRVEYCRLLLAEFIQRTSRNLELKSQLFHELALMRRNAGSLFLHRASIDEITDSLKDILDV